MVSIDKGLIVPTIFNCDKLNVIQISKIRNNLVKKAREDRLSLEEVANGTFTITNLGMFGIKSFSAIINPPQAAILGIGKIYSTPAKINGKIDLKPVMELSISVDHRIIDGALAARFIQRIVELIENPEIIITLL